MDSIGQRVRHALKGQGMTQKDLAERIGIAPDALSRALNGARGFAAVEIAEIARALEADLYELITGEADPSRLVLSARHTYDPETGCRSVEGAQEDQRILADVRLAYEQAGPSAPTGSLPPSAAALRAALGTDFVRDFADRLEGLGVDVVRVQRLSTAYSFHIGERAVIALGASGNWFHANWSLAHEAAHHCLGHAGVMPDAPGFENREIEANAFAAELLLPEQVIRGTDWKDLSRADLARLVWAWGVSTDALRRRLAALDAEVSPDVASALDQSTQGLLRRSWSEGRRGDPITARMEAAGRRRFPAWLTASHLERIAQGAVGKATLAWMLDVDEESLEVDAPAEAAEPSLDELEALLG